MKTKIKFPTFKGVRCLMMPYIQGDPKSVPKEFRNGYEEILETVFLEKDKIGFLTIDESLAKAGKPHRGTRSKFERALHTEAGKHPNASYAWGGNTWGGGNRVTLNRDTRVLLANSVDDSCAIWNSEHPDTSIDGDIGHLADMYPYEDAIIMKAGEVHEMGILHPHESLPVKENVYRQFLRIIGDGVKGREPHFTMNPLVALP